MLAALLLALREGLEAALLVGIILGYLGQIGRQDRRKSVWQAVALAAACSLALALALQALGAQFEGQAEALFEGVAMLTAVGVLTWMILWMRFQARNIKTNLQAGVHVAIHRGQNRALFSLAFLAVFREGVELALFLTATNLVTDGLSTVVGSVLGLALAVAFGFAIYSGSMRLNLRRFFDVTSVLLLVFAAGLFAHGIHELQEAGMLPVLVEHVWNLKPVLDDGSTVGALLRVLVGYNDNPSLLEVLGYAGYWAALLLLVQWWVPRQASQRNAAVEVGPGVGSGD